MLLFWNLFAQLAVHLRKSEEVTMESNDKASADLRKSPGNESNHPEMDVVLNFNS